MCIIQLIRACIAHLILGFFGVLLYAALILTKIVLFLIVHIQLRMAPKTRLAVVCYNPLCATWMYVINWHYIVKEEVECSNIYGVPFVRP